MLHPDHLDQLNAIFDKDRVLTDAGSLKEYGRDWTKNIEPKPSVIVFPKSTDEVVRLVKMAIEQKLALVPSGGRTGLSGGALAQNGEVVVSFQRMNKILDFNSTDQVVTVESGVITESVQDFAKEQGLYFPVDFASRGSSQIGGNVATNAGGIKVLRYGLTRNWVSGLEAVTGTGEVLNLNNSLIKNATGYDLRHLLIGSEGTLALITKVTLALTHPPKEPLVFLFAVEDLSAVMKVFDIYRAKLPILAFEMFTELSLKYVLKHHTDLKRPLDSSHPYYLLVELEGLNASVEEEAMALFEKGLEMGLIQDGTMAQSPSQAKDLWRLREDISEATAPYSPYKNDISVRISKVPEFLTQMSDILNREYPDFEACWFGHIGDGNLHINILKPTDMSSAEFVKACQKVDDKMFGMIESLGGSVSAEHGVGLTKKPFLHHTRSKAEIAIMKGIKQTFDPHGILNPGKLF